ncbi:hypothetical protein [Calorimonas adulescens]|uniref:Helix-turn-helix domain-containing protein n=1 Tax=Calorimonas adulescens TaxID=2606906 RepID=A0A5D8QBN2_9THEO|nr:hypothetical protein [Calorimonas adulescens]TZE80943.1 hypothetical protein FWJ32_11135 [Calorimonas adulescens]
MKSVSFKRLVASLLVGGTLITGGIALAASNDSITVTDNATTTVTRQYLGLGYQAMRDGERPGLRIGGAKGMNQEVADFLGVSIEDLIAKRQSGMSLADIAKEKGITEEQLINFISENRNEALKKLVDEGKITQAQLEQHQTYMEQRIKQNIESTSTGPKGLGNGMAQGRRAGR